MEGDVNIVGYATTDQGASYPHRSRGTRLVVRELSLQPLWIAPVQMLQLEAGHRWCSCCGEVYPDDMFNPLLLDAETCTLLLGYIAIEFKLLRASPALYRAAEILPGTLFKWCVNCQTRYAPETMGLQYCPKCQMWREASDFYSPKSWLCIPHEKERKREEYQAEMGRDVRAYTRRK